MKAFLASLVVLLVTFTSLTAQQNGGRIFGTVTEAGTSDPVSGVSVRISPVEDSTSVIHVSTEISGEYAFTSIPAGSYRLVFSRVGYEPESSRIVTIADGERKRIDRAMAERIPLLGEVVSSASRISEKNLDAVALVTMNRPG